MVKGDFMEKKYDNFVDTVKGLMVDDDLQGFEEYMTPPQEFVPSEDDLKALQIIRECVESGKSCEVKLNIKNNTLSVYEIDRKAKKRS